MMANGRFQKQALLPPRSPFPVAAPHAELGPIARPRETPHRHGHQRTSSESFLADEQPSSSDSFALFEGGSAAGGMYEFDNVLDGMRGGGQVASLAGAPEFFPEPASFGRPWESRQMYRQGGGMPMPGREKNGGRHGPSSSFGEHELGHVPNGVNRKAHGDAAYDQRIVIERKEGLRHSQSETDTKRAKQQYAQRSRVRKLQYIAELERRVQSLQTEGIEVTAEMDFLGQQNIMLDLENKALKQRLESLSQEHLIKRYQQEMFEREIGRLRTLFQQQQQQQHVPQQQAPTHSRSNSRDLDSQFANLSLKHSDPSSGRDAISGLRI
uniref:BZIP domain-containing protein n=2 Tax=Zea mays TaxID=4577 RepID=A0A804N6H3_MAIZE